MNLQNLCFYRVKLQDEWTVGLYIEADKGFWIAGGDNEPVLPEWCDIVDDTPIEFPKD